MSSLIEMKRELNSHEFEILRSEFDRKKKSTGIAYILWFFLSVLGLHKFYQGKILEGFLVITGPLIAFVTIGIGFSGALAGYTVAGSSFMGVGVLGLSVYAVWWLIDLFTLHWQIERVNHKIEYEILANIKKQTQIGIAPELVSTSDRRKEIDLMRIEEMFDKSLITEEERTQMRNKLL